MTPEERAKAVRLPFSVGQGVQRETARVDIIAAITAAEEAEREAIIKNINARIVFLQELIDTHYRNADESAVMSTQSAINSCIGTIEEIRARGTA